MGAQGSSQATGHPNQSFVHVNDISGVSSGSLVNQSAGTTALLNQTSKSLIAHDAHFRAEYKLLTDFIVSVPKVRVHTLAPTIQAS
mgnify:CR=1 FL=1